jgi:hypothetical protein
MQGAGATVKYYSVNVRDEQAFGNLIEEVYRSYGRLDGVIHGAGIIEDKLVADKTHESFDRVYNTKVDSAYVLAKRVKADSLRFLVFFSSVSARFGSRGQGDYSAANEVLNKMAVYLDKKWPGRICAMNWGPWERTGMVAAEVQKQFSELGVQLVPPPLGRQMFVKELCYGKKGDSEIVIGDGPWEKLVIHQADAPEDIYPLLNKTSFKTWDNGSFVVTRTLDTKFDKYLQDHRLDGKLVFPVAMAVELMTEAVQEKFPEWKVTSLHDLKVLKGIVVDKGVKEIQVIAQPSENFSKATSHLQMDIKIGTSDNPEYTCYHATVRLGKSLPTPNPFASDVWSDLKSFPMTVEEAYKKWLFHGPVFHGITKIKGVNERGAHAVFRASTPFECLEVAQQSQWLIDPVVFDCGLQLAILWSRHYYDLTPLPSGFNAYHRFCASQRYPTHCYLQMLPKANNHIQVSDLHFLDENGQVTAYLQGLEMVGSKEFNRLVK